MIFQNTSVSFQYANQIKRMTKIEIINKETYRIHTIWHIQGDIGWKLNWLNIGMTVTKYLNSWSGSTNVSYSGNGPKLTRVVTLVTGKFDGVFIDYYC